MEIRRSSVVDTAQSGFTAGTRGSKSRI